MKLYLPRLISVLLCLTLFSFPAFSAETGERPYIFVDDSNYAKEVMEARGPVIVFFYAEWCPFSGSLIPIYEEIENEFSDRVKFCRFRLGRQYSDFSSPEGKKLWAGLFQKYKVNSIPSLVMFNDGKEIDRMTGRPEKELVSIYRGLLEKWIETNIIDPQDRPFVFEGSLLLHKKK